jgi:hypothetical protein
MNNPGRSALTVPGQGSPLSGADHTTPAVETESLLTHHFSQPNINANPGNGAFKHPGARHGGQGRAVGQQPPHGGVPLSPGAGLEGDADERRSFRGAASPEDRKLC